MSQNDHRHVFVAQAESSSLSEIEIYELLSAAEIDLSTVVFIKTGEDLPEVAAQDALVTILPTELVPDTSLEQLALQATAAGVCSIVGVWPVGVAAEGIHPAASKYHTSQIPWDGDALEKELGSDCANAFLTPDGEEAKRNEVDPHECD
jgi:hypothetical protein